MDNQITPPPGPPDEPAGPSAQGPRLHAEPAAPPRPDPINYQPPVIKRPKRPVSYRSRGFWSLFQLIAGALVLAFLINQIVFQSYEVFGQSMAPTLQEGDRLIISKLGRSWSDLTGHDYIPKRGEIVVFHNPGQDATQLVKRVAGLPGDRVVINGGEIMIMTPDEPRGFNFDERFGLELAPTVGSVDYVVPRGEIFVIGDNRTPGGSLDSRNDLGTIPTEDLVGDLVVRIFPLPDAAWF